MCDETNGDEDVFYFPPSEVATCSPRLPIFIHSMCFLVIAQIDQVFCHFMGYGGPINCRLKGSPH